ncbi:hypothetical protein K432DRAFT_296965, partial [Lepidopterella palustris CBS 459.81]
PAPNAYYALCASAGLAPPPLSAIPRSLSNSVASYVAFEAANMVSPTQAADYQAPITMSRLIRVGALFVQVVDMAVKSRPSRKGFVS